MKTLSIVLLVIAGVCIFEGLYHLWFYQTPQEDITAGTNAYVGGDAFNYIINSTKASAYFILSLCFIIPACFILYKAKEKEKKNVYQPLFPKE